MDGFSKRLFYVYLAYWFLSFFFTALNLADLYEIESTTFIMVALHIFMFWLGYSKPIRINKNRNIDLDGASVLANKMINSVVFKVILAVSIVYLASLVAIFYERVLYYNSMGDARTDYYEYNMYGPFFGLIHDIFLTPFNCLVLVLLCISIVKIKVLSWNNFFLLVYVMLFNSLSGGRGGYLAIIWCLIFIAFCVQNLFKKHVFRFSIYSIPLIIALFVLLSFMTAARMGEVSLSKESWEKGNEKLTQGFVVYTSGPLVAFDHAVKYNYVKLVGGYKYGGLTLTAPITLYNIIGRKVGLEVHQAINDVVELKQGTQFEIGEGNWYNALYTACLWYYLDFGFWGLIIIPFFLGWLVRWVIKISYRYQTIPMMVILYMTYNYTIKSVMDFYLNAPLTLLVIIVFFIWGKNSKAFNIAYISVQ